MRFCLIMFLCLFNFALTAQSKLEKIELANQAIEQLRDGVLLVELDSRYGEIFVLQKYLKQQMASDLKKEQYLRNKEICLAFKEEYDFSEVYFYYKAYKKFLLNDDFNKVVFYNDKLEIDYDFDITTQPFYVATFEDYGKLGLHIYDKQLQTIAKPFPNYEKEQRLIFFKRDAFEVVSSWNEKLHNFLALFEYRKNKK